MKDFNHTTAPPAHEGQDESPTLQLAQADTVADVGPDAVGTVQVATGSVTIIRASGETSPLTVGESVFLGDEVRTGEGSTLGIVLVDKSVASMGANSNLILNDLVFDPAGTSNSMVLDLVEGSFGFLSGGIASTGDMQLKTPVAVMAIRGTLPLAFIGPDGSTQFIAGSDHGFDILNLLTGKLIIRVDDPGKVYLLSESGGVPKIVSLDPALQEKIGEILKIVGKTTDHADLFDLIKKTGSPLFELVDFETIDRSGFVASVAALAPLLTPEQLATEFISLELPNPALQIIAENESPVVAAVDLGSIDDDGSILITQAALLAGASDAEGDPLTALNLTLTSGNGELIDNGDGTWTFIPDDNFNGQVSFSFDVSDGTAVTPNTASLTVADDAPAVEITDPAPANVTEGAVLSGTWTLTTGADGVTSVEVTVGSITKILPLTPGASVTIGAADGFTLGTLTVDADGEWHFMANPVTANQSFTFSVTAIDGDGDAATDSQSINIFNVDTPLVINGAVSGVVEEEQGLPGGIEDTDDQDGLDTDGSSPQVTNIVAGSFGALIASGIDGTLSFAFALSGNTAVQTVSDGPLLSGGMPVLFAIDGGNLIGYVNSDGGTGPFGAGDTKIFTLALTNTATGAYSFTLHASVDHPGNSVEDAIAINLNGLVTVTDSGGPSPADTNVPLNASITIIDDVPVAETNTHEVGEAILSTVDIQFIVDMSGSMFSSNVGFDVPGFADNRAGLARYSMLEMLQNNDQIQNVQLVLFGSSATGSVWMTKADAIAFIQADANWPNLGTTNYDLALQTAISSFSGAKPLAESDQTFVYFLSDGVPNGGGIEPGGVTPPGDGVITITDWENHVTGQGIDQVFAIGIGNGVTTGNLSPISYPNDDGPDAGTLEDRVIVVGTANVNVLLDTLEDFLHSPSSISGNILADDPSSSTGADAFGADGGRILSIAIDGITYTYDPTGNDISASSGPLPAQDTPALTVTTVLGGTLTFYFADADANSAGSWTYVTGSAGPESFTYVLVDNDGDQATADLNITVLPVNNNTLVNMDIGAADFAAASFAFTDLDTLALASLDLPQPGEPPQPRESWIDPAALGPVASVADFVVGDGAIDLNDLFETVETTNTAGPRTAWAPQAGASPAPHDPVEVTASILYNPDHDNDHHQG